MYGHSTCEILDSNMITTWTVFVVGILHHGSKNQSNHLILQIKQFIKSKRCVFCVLVLRKYIVTEFWLLNLNLQLSAFFLNRVWYTGSRAGLDNRLRLSTCVHFFRPECNTGMSVMVYYTPPGVRILHSSRFSEDSNQASALQQGKI
jgi:hypothetical protein